MICLHESIIERLIYKAVKRHIAGTTISSAIEAAKRFNDKNVPVSITFLSSSVDTVAKARYVASTYSELLHRIARFGLRASVHIPLDEIGFSLSRDYATEYLKSILQLGNKLGVFIWAELPEKLNSKYSLPDAKGLGYALSVSRYAADSFSKPAIKLMFNEYSNVEKKQKGKNAREKDKDDYKKELGIIAKAARSSNSVVLQSPPEKLIHRLLKMQQYKKSLIFEFQLGYEKKELNSVMKRGWRASVFVPFGKGWVDFATNRIQGHYTHLLASKLLENREKVK